MNRSAWDEDADEEDDVVRCFECGVGLDEDCPHLLLYADVTFGQCSGGVAFDYWDRYYAQVQEVFAKLLREKLSPDWDQCAVLDVWRDMTRDRIDNPEQPDLPCGAFINLIVEVLGAAGGAEHPGSLATRSGAYSESAVRVMYAGDPTATCEAAFKILAEWLVPASKPAKRRGRKR